MRDRQQAPPVKQKFYYEGVPPEGDPAYIAKITKRKALIARRVSHIANISQKHPYVGRALTRYCEAVGKLSNKY